jgi:hypothetical protein
MENKTLLIDKNKFCDWYFDYEVCKDFFHDQNILEELKKHGTYSFNLQKVLNGMEYVPEHVVAEGQEPIIDEWENVFLWTYDNVTFAD